MPAFPLKTIDIATLDQLIQQMPGIYWIVDLDQRIQHSGGAVQELLGYAPGRHLGKTLFEVFVEETGSNDTTDLHARALAGESIPFSNEYYGRTLSSRVAPLRDSAGTIIGAIGTSLDVTAWRQLEQRMIDAQRAESLGVLAGGLAHDFNNLLVAILGNADLALREIPKGAPGRLSLENIRNAALSAADLTEQLLAYAGRGSVATTRLAPAPLVAELVQISRAAMPAATSVVVDIPADLVVRGDPSQMRQIVLNLMNNGRDALGERGGTVTISGRLERIEEATADDIITATPGTYVMIEVADDGPGIDRAGRRRVFEPFFTTKATGHGLGLAAVVGIVRSHHGGLRLVSEPNRGCRFQVFLPSNVTPVAMATVTTPSTRTILVIDDEDLVREVVARMIEDLGYATVTAADGMAGLAVMDRQTVDAVLVDLTMPRMSGAELVNQIRKRSPTLPVVLCSGFVGRSDMSGADAYLPKPFRMEALEQTLTKILGNAS